MEIGVVVVTYNRIDKLKIALKSYEKQTILPKYILVVNNNSTDGTKEYLEEWKKEQNGIEKIIINLEKNTGGSGGFYEGLKNSLNLNAKWVWVADDDAYPKEDAFEVAQKYFEEHKNDNLSAICGTVYTANETIDYSHRRNIYTRFGTIVQKYSNKKDYEKDEFEINTFSYVGSLMNLEKLKKTELPKKDYFIYYDDTEHSYRLSKLGKIVCLPKMKIIHDAPHSKMNEIVKWKLYYLIRNALDFVKCNFDEKYFKRACFDIPFAFKIAVLLYGKNKKAGLKMIDVGREDAIKGITGLHNIYKPGWKPEK